VNINFDFNQTPSGFELFQNFPNPFNPMTIIQYNLPISTKVSIIIVDSHGALINTLLTKDQTAGKKSIIWNGENNKGAKVSTGIYFYRLKTKQFSTTNKMVYIK
jgi:flagellar hook assembly protein FlgD